METNYKRKDFLLPRRFLIRWFDEILYLIGFSVSLSFIIQLFPLLTNWLLGIVCIIFLIGYLLTSWYFDQIQESKIQYQLRLLWGFLGLLVWILLILFVALTLNESDTPRSFLIYLSLFTFFPASNYLRILRPHRSENIIILTLFICICIGVACYLAGYQVIESINAGVILFALILVTYGVRRSYARVESQQNMILEIPRYLNSLQQDEIIIGKSPLTILAKKIIELIHPLYPESIVTILNLEHVEEIKDDLLRIDKSNQGAFSFLQLRLVHAAGVPQLSIEKLNNQPWQANKGITGKAIQEIKTQNIPDCSKKESNYYSTQGWPTAGSELAIPISSGGYVFGVLDFQRIKRDPFELSDELYGEIIAQLIADFLLLQMIEETDIVKKRLHKLLENENDERAMVERFFDICRELCEFDLLTYYPLGYGSWYPNTPPIFLGKFINENQMKQPIRNPENAIVKLVSRWEDCYYPNVFEQSEEIPTHISDIYGKPFCIREAVNSMCFLPIGFNREERIGALFLSYHGKERFSIPRRMAITALTNVLIMHLARARHLQGFYKFFNEPEFVLHRYLNDRGIGKGEIGSKFEKWIDELKTSLSSNQRDNIREDLIDFKSRLIQSLKQSNLANIKLNKELDFGLQHALMSWRSELDLHLKSGEKFTILPKVDKAEHYSKAFKRILYILIVEATSNSYEHGKSTRVDINIEIENDFLKVIIDDNGEGLPENARENGNQGGIFDILNRINDTKVGLSANNDWGKSHFGGARLRVQIPLLTENFGDLS